MFGDRKRPAPFFGFSPFDRSLLFSTFGYSKSRPPPSAAKPPQENTTSGHDMPPPPPKRAKRPKSASDEERYSSNSDCPLDSDGDDDSSEELETVQVNFAFFDPKPTGYLDSKPWDLTGFVDLILV